MSVLNDTDLVFIGLTGEDVKQAVTDLEHYSKADSTLAESDGVEPLRPSKGLQSILDALYHALHNGVDPITDEEASQFDEEGVL